MAAKATEVPFGAGNQFMGELKVARFNIFEDEDMERYGRLRTEANNAASGIKIDHVKEYTRKTVLREGSGEEQIVTTTDEVFIVVHYWEKKPKLKQGTNNESTKDLQPS